MGHRKNHAMLDPGYPLASPSVESVVSGHVLSRHPQALAWEPVDSMDHHSRVRGRWGDQCPPLAPQMAAQGRFPLTLPGPGVLFSPLTPGPVARRMRQQYPQLGSSLVARGAG